MRIAISAAVTIDGYIDDREPERLVLSSPEDLDDMRHARAACEAVLVGAGTVRIDNPSLRAPAGLPAPMRVTLTASGRLDPHARFFDGSARAVVLAVGGCAGELARQLHARAQIVPIEDGSPDSIVRALEALGVQSLFVEGGTTVLTAFLAAGAFDTLRLAIAPFFAGERGGARFVDRASFKDGSRHRLLLREVRAYGETAVLQYERQT